VLNTPEQFSEKTSFAKGMPCGAPPESKQAENFACGVQQAFGFQWILYFVSHKEENIQKVIHFGEKMHPYVL
jgi:hypothetical protein